MHLIERSAYCHDMNIIKQADTGRSSVFKSHWPLPHSACSHHTFFPASLFLQRLADWCSRGDQLVVGPLQVHELVVCSLLYHDAPGHDGDDVGVLNSGQAVGDHDAGASLPGFVQGLLHCLSTHIDRQEASPLPPERCYNLIAISRSCINYYAWNASEDQPAAEHPLSSAWFSPFKPKTHCRHRWYSSSRGPTGGLLWTVRRWKGWCMIMILRMMIK